MEEDKRYLSENEIAQKICNKLGCIDSFHSDYHDYKMIGGKLCCLDQNRNWMLYFSGELVLRMIEVAQGNSWVLKWNNGHYSFISLIDIPEKSTSLFSISDVKAMGYSFLEIFDNTLSTQNGSQENDASQIIENKEGYDYPI